MALDLTQNQNRPLTVTEALSGGGTVTTTITASDYDRQVHVRCDAAFEFKCGDETGTPAPAFVPAGANVWTLVYLRCPNVGQRSKVISVRAASGTNVYVSAIGTAD